MANNKRYSGLTRQQQRRRNASAFRRMAANGVDTSAAGNWNTAYGAATEFARRDGKNPYSYRRENGDIYSSGSNWGQAVYPNQSRNAQTRKSYRQVRAAFGLSAG